MPRLHFLDAIRPLWFQMFSLSSKAIQTSLKPASSLCTEGEGAQPSMAEGPRENHLFSPEIPSKSVSFPELEIRAQVNLLSPLLGRCPPQNRVFIERVGLLDQTLPCTAMKGSVHMGITRGFSA